MERFINGFSLKDTLKQIADHGADIKQQLHTSVDARANGTAEPADTLKLGIGCDLMKTVR